MPAEDTLIIRMRTEGGVVAEVEIGAVGREMEKVEKQAGKTSKSVSGFGKGMSGLRGLAQGLAFGGLAVGIGEVAKRTMELQQQQATLGNSLKQSHQPVAATTKVMTEYSDKLSQAGGFATPEDLQALNNFTTAGEKSSEAMKNLALATDIARARHLDLLATTRLVSQAEMGRSTGLSRLGINIPKVTTAEDALKASGQKATIAQKEAAKQQDAMATKMKTMQVLQDRFRGSTEAYSKTTAGSWSNLKNEFEVMETNLGQKLLPMITSLIKWMAQHKDVVKDVVIAVAALTAAYAAYEVIVKAVAIAHDIQAAAAWAAEKAEAALDLVMDANPIFLVVAAIVALVAIFVVLWVKCKWFRDFWKDLWKDILGIITAVWGWIKQNWPLLAGILLGPIAFAIAEIIKHWKSIEKLPGEFLSVLKAGWKLVTNFFGQMITDAGNLGKKIVDAIVNEIKKLPHQVLGILEKIPVVGGIIKGAAGVAGSVIHAGGGILHGIGSAIGLQSGGTVSSTGAFVVGERGPELVSLPRGSTVSTNADIEVLADLLRQLIAVEQQNSRALVVDGQILAQAVARASSRQLALR